MLCINGKTTLTHFARKKRRLLSFQSETKSVNPYRDKKDKSPNSEREKAFEQHLLKEREVVVLMVMPNKEDYSGIPQELQPLLQKYKDL